MPIFARNRPICYHRDMTRNVTQYDAMAHISSPGRISSSESVKGISGKIRKSPLVAGISSGISSRVAALLPSDAKTAATGLAAYADAGGFGHVEAVVESATLRLKRVDFSSHAAAESEICRMLANPAVRQLRFSDLKTLEERRFVASIVARNFPLLEVGRLIPGHSIANVSFSGIKKLNDRFGQEFVDHIIDAAKAFLQADFERTSGHDTANWRVVRDDYRNFTVSLPRGADPVKSLF
ncbi:MAG: hypothetical protein QG650_1018 [Patescibacteria group bacterium]|nr:hypothetical protein [Patescibacteria group bacterium]